MRDFFRRIFDSTSFVDRYRQTPEASLKDREDEQLDEVALVPRGEDSSSRLGCPPSQDAIVTTRIIFPFVGSGIPT